MIYISIIVYFVMFYGDVIVSGLSGKRDFSLDEKPKKRNTVE